LGAAHRGQRMAKNCERPWQNQGITCIFYSCPAGLETRRLATIWIDSLPSGYNSKAVHGVRRTPGAVPAPGASS